MKSELTPDFAVLIESLDEGIAQLDNEGKIVYCNAKLASIVGIEKHSAIDTFFWDYLPPEEIETFKIVFSECTKSLPSYTKTLWINTIPCKVKLKVHRNEADEHGQILLLIYPLEEDAFFTRSVLDKSRLFSSSHTMDVSLSQNEDDFIQVILNTMTESVVVYNAAGTLVYMNEAGKDMINMASINNIKENVRLYYSDKETLIPEKRHPKWKILGGNLIEEQEIYVHNAVANVGAFISIKGQPLYNQTGNIVGGIIIGVDISERRASDFEMRKSSELLSQAQKMASIGHWEVDLLANEVFWSEETKAIHEVPQSFKPTFDAAVHFYTVESLAVISKTIEESVKTGESWDLKLTIKTSKGNLKYVRTIGRVVKVNGVATKIYGVFQDVSKDQQKDEQLIAFVDAAPAAIAMFDKDISYIAASETWYKTYNLEGVEIIGKGHYEIFPEITGGWKEIHQRALKGELCKAEEDRFDRLDGSVQWLKWEVRPWYAMSGEIGGIIMLTEDITLEKQAKEELRMAKEAAEEASIAKEEFLSTMSHEIRTPMNAVIGMTHLLLQEEKLPHQEENLRTLQFSAENLLVLINDILDFNKITAGKINLENTAFNLRELAYNIRKSFEFKSQEKYLRLSFIFDTDIPEYLMGDPTRLSQILTNLIGNAVKFTTKGMVRLTVQLVKEDMESVTIYFSVKDTGIGIPKEYHKTIFERFNQAGKETTRKFGGTGLGLAITKKLLELFGSDILLKSEPGKGSEFKFEITFDKVKNMQEINNKVKYEEGDHETAGIQVLLVEDNKVNQIVACKFLDNWNISVDIAENGQEAVDKVHNASYDLILMDLQMPVMDGYEATKEIRKNTSFDSLPIVALTADATTDIKNKVQEVGMTDFLTKPINPQELYNKIVQVTAHRQVDSKEQSQEQPEDNDAATQDMLDYALIKQLSDGDNSFFKNLIISFKNELVKFNEEYEGFINDKDADQLKALRHKMKPSFELFSTTHLADALDEGIDIVEKEKFDEINTSVKKVKMLGDSVINQLVEKENTL